MKFSSSLFSSLALIVAMPPNNRSGFGILPANACGGGEAGHYHDEDFHHHDRKLDPGLGFDGLEDESPTSFYCTTPELSDDELDLMDDQADAWEQAEMDNDASSGNVRGRRDLGSAVSIAKGPVKVINTVVHLVNHTYTRGRPNMVTPKMIDDQIEVLNQAFAPGKFQFNLVGTTYSVNNYWFIPFLHPLEQPEEWGAYREDMGRELKMGGADTLNVYLVWGGGFGYSSYPNEYMKHPYRDGILLNPGVLPGSTKKPYDTGLTGVHEVGHWLGLLHTFHGGCGAGAGANGGDRVLDTNPEAEYAVGCPIGRDTCNNTAHDTGPDPIQNYMDYSDCVNHFTAGQFKRMNKHWYAFRAAKSKGKHGGNNNKGNE